MKNILIINLRRIGDVYTTGHMLNSLSKIEGNNVSILVFKECQKAAVNLKNLKAVHTIDRQEILTLKNSKLFSDGFALEQLYRQLAVLKSHKWDEIINYSNDVTGAYICSFLKGSAEKIIGVHYNESRNIVTSSDWEILFNDVLPTVQYAPIHFVDCYHKMAGIPYNAQGEKILSNTRHNATAFSNLNTVRQNLGISPSVNKLVGIQLKTADPAKDIPQELLTGFIKLMRENAELIPILLIAPIDQERRYAIEINTQFNNELVVVEADLEAITSVLMNIDLLVTPDTAIKHIADLTDTPVLEISLGHAPFLKQGTYSNGSLILTDTISERTFTRNAANKESATKISPQDIISSIMFYFAKTKAVRPNLSPGVTLYSCNFDQLGARYSVVAGTVDGQTEIHRLMLRQLINVIYDSHESPDIYKDVLDFGTSAASNWCTSEKTIITQVMKDLLGTLRSLLQSQENRKSSREFVSNLSKLINHADTNSLVQVPVMMFKTKIECINAKTFEENAKEVELLLYEMKTDIQKILSCIKNLEEDISRFKKDEFMARSATETSSN